MLTQTAHQITWSQSFHLATNTTKYMKDYEPSTNSSLAIEPLVYLFFGKINLKGNLRTQPNYNIIIFFIAL
jgi:hypothetical protein